MSLFPQAAVIGHPIGHSKSPRIHRYWLEKYQIQGDYIRLDVPPDLFGRSLEMLASIGFRGANVTIPHKEAALAAADHVSERACLIGAANTLIFQDNEIIADNTDGHGFLANLREKAPAWKPGSALVLGAGGAARAVIVALAEAGVAQILLANRTPSRAEALAHALPAPIETIAWEAIPARLKDADLLVNTTSLGMTGQPPLEIDLAPLPSHAVVTDLVYAPLMTDLLKRARARDLHVVDGLGMLLHQAAPGFEAWFGTMPEVDDALREKVLK